MGSSSRLSKDVTATSSKDVTHDFINDRGTFVFWNGDAYNGEYLATKTPLSIVREGIGTYWVNDGSVYEGRWSRDYLEKADQIAFPDKSQFSGTLENMVAEGPGTYKFKEGVEINGFLTNNQFTGDVELKDPTGHYWRSTNSNDDTKLVFSPVQVFWEAIINKRNDLLSCESEDGP